MKIEESTIGVLGGFPPEHNAHVIESVSYIRALQSMRFKHVIGLASSESRGRVEMLTDNLDAHHARGIIDPLAFPHIPVLNVHEHTDGYNINTCEVETMIRDARIDIVFLTYLPLFGEQLTELLAKMRTKMICLAKMALVRPGQENIFAQYHRGYGQVLQSVDAVLTYQENDRNLLKTFYPVTRGKSFVAHKFVDEELLAAARERRSSVLQKYGLADFFSDADHMVGFIGRIDPEKNALHFIERVWPLVLEHIKNARLLMVGRGTQSDVLGKIAGRTSNVRLLDKSLPYVDALALLAHIDVVAAPSGTDYTPRIPMDALLMGSKVVANDLNFNAVYRPYAHLAPVREFAEYSPYGYNDNTRMLRESVNRKEYGVPDPQAFAAGIVRSLLNTDEPMSLPDSLFTSKGFVQEFSQALKIVTA